MKMGKDGEDIRCTWCEKVLAKIKDGKNVVLEIKCPKCKTIITYKTEAQEAQVN